MKTVLITGTSRGIGKALAEKFIAEGWSVIGTCLDGQSSFVKDKNLKMYELDLSKSKSIQKFADQLLSSGVKIDVLINNAGVLLDNDDTTVVIDKLRKTLEVNVIGMIDLTERLLALLAPGAHVVNISSSAGSLSGAMDLRASHYPYHYPAYKISKVAVNMYTRTLANRFQRDGKSVIVSSVHPGWVSTEMGGEEAPISPKEAAHDIFTFAISNPPTGGFWFKGEKLEW